MPSSPKILVVGAGAIGGFIGGILAARTSSHVTLLARGEHLHALRSGGGLKLVIDAESKQHKNTIMVTNLNMVGSLHEAAMMHGPYDVVFITVKAHQLLAIARDKAWSKTIHAKTILVPLQNGMPWYAFLQLPATTHPFAGRQLMSVDPTSELAKAFPTNQVVGAIAMPACVINTPGEVIHEGNWAIPIGTFNKELSTRLVDIMSPAGFKMQPRDDFLEELFVKSLGSAVFNPASALTGATLGQLADEKDEFARGLCMDAMNEVRSIAKIVLGGKNVHVSNEQRLNGAKRLGFHKTSMLQDVLAGKVELEIDCLVGTLVEIASWCDDATTPVLRTLFRLIKLKQRVMREETKKMPSSSL